MMMMMSNRETTMSFYYGEHDCMGRLANGKPCRNKAYWSVNDRSGQLLLCGTHSKKYGNDRKELLKNPDRDTVVKNELIAHRASIEAQAARNRSLGHAGMLTCSKMLMMRHLGLIPGTLNVFPNFKHGNRKDGFGCPDLSPKSMGPVSHGQPGLPDALTIENYHQFNKVFPHEVSEDGSPLPTFHSTRLAGYLDPVPHRHKLNAVQRSGLANVNIPVYSVHLDIHGHERRFSYLESRAFYCRQYELLAPSQPSFIELRHRLDEGTDMRIVGYDGYEPTSMPGVGESNLERQLEACYRDISRPFGHELVLYTMLALTLDDASRFPWNQYVAAHPETYRGMPSWLFG